MGHDSQLNLRVVGRNNPGARGRHKGLTDFAALRGPHRNILQIGVRTCEAPGDGRCLTECRVNPAVGGICHQRELIRVGALEFRETPVVQNEFGQRIIKRQFSENFFVRRRRSRGRLFLHRKPELIKEDVGKLLGTCGVKGVARQFLNLGFNPLDFFAHRRRQCLEFCDVNVYARALHFPQDRTDRQFNGFINAREAGVRGHPGLHDGSSRSQTRRCRREKRPDSRCGHLRHLLFLRAFTQEILFRGKRHGTVAGRKFLQIVL